MIGAVCNITIKEEHVTRDAYDLTDIIFLSFLHERFPVDTPLFIAGGYSISIMFLSAPMMRSSSSLPSINRSTHIIKLRRFFAR